LAGALEDTLTSKTLDPAFKALTLSLPTENLIARTIGANVDPSKVRSVRLALIASLASRLESTLEATYRANTPMGPYLPDTAQSGMRALKNGALLMLTLGGRAAGAKLAREQYESAVNMTDRA